MKEPGPGRKLTAAVEPLSLSRGGHNMVVRHGRSLHAQLLGLSAMPNSCTPFILSFSNQRILLIIETITGELQFSDDKLSRTSLSGARMLQAIHSMASSERFSRRFARCPPTNHLEPVGLRSGLHSIRP